MNTTTTASDLATQKWLKEKLLDLGVDESVAQIASNIEDVNVRKAVWNAITKIRMLEGLRILENLKEEVTDKIEEYQREIRNVAKLRELH